MQIDTVDGATDREDLRLDPEAIERYVNAEHGHHYFLFSVVSFFSHSLIEGIFATAGIPALVYLAYIIWMPFRHNA